MNKGNVSCTMKNCQAQRCPVDASSGYYSKWYTHARYSIKKSLIEIWFVEVKVLEFENFCISFSNTRVACFVRGGSGHDIFMIMCKTHTHPSVRADGFFSLKEI